MKQLSGDCSSGGVSWSASTRHSHNVLFQRTSVASPESGLFRLLLSAFVHLKPGGRNGHQCAHQVFVYAMALTLYIINHRIFGFDPVKNKSSGRVAAPDARKQ